MPKLNLPDQKMLDAIAILKDRGDIRFRQEFCDAIDMPKQSIAAIKTGEKHFTPIHIMKACKAFGIDANWVFGLGGQFNLKAAPVRFISQSKPNNKKSNSVIRKTVK